jgi:multidrug resistance efflux pump
MTDFARSFCRLRADRGNATIWVMFGAVATLAAWWCWAVLAQISLYEVSADARVELDGATYAVGCPFPGRIVAANLRVGQSVRRGDLLVEIDSTPEQLRLREQEVQIDGLDPQIAHLQSQIDAEDGAGNAEERGTHLSQGEAESRVREAEIQVRFAEQELARMRSLYAQQLVSTRDMEKAQSEAGRLRSAVTALEAAADQVPQAQKGRNRARDVRIARLQGEIATLAAQRQTLRAETTRLSYEIERRRIRAPIDGRVGETVNLRVGTVVSEGERLGSIVPSGRLLIVAQYPAPGAMGRIRAGQSATLRLAGFPWAEFGTVSATVTGVAQEVRDGRVRVELALTNHSSFRGTLEHGMPGTLEVAVERVSPFGLILRTAGQWLTQPL